MRILIAGGCGYVGSYLIPLLLERGYEVEVIDLLWFGNNLPKKVKVTKKSLFDCDVEDLKGFDQVIFLAGVSNDPMAEFWPSENFIQNAAAPSYLAFVAKKAGVKRYIYASSCSVYGYTIDKLYNEDSPTVCDYPYGISKLQGEKAVMQLCTEDFSTISLRKGTVCGHSPRMRFDLVVNAMFKSAMTTGKLTVNNPAIWRPILSIKDCANAYIRAIQANKSINGVFNISSDNYTVGQIGDIVKDEVEVLTGKKIRMHIKDIHDFRNYKVSIDKAKVLLGFQPDNTIKDIVKGLYSHSLEYGNYMNDLYYNIKILEKVKKEALD
jgi:nucleoside-diphosphate-sugar epimerase